MGQRGKIGANRFYYYVKWCYIMVILGFLQKNKTATNAFI